MLIKIDFRFLYGGKESYYILYGDRMNMDTKCYNEYTGDFIF